jgi:hypothetical protein
MKKLAIFALLALASAAHATEEASYSCVELESFFKNPKPGALTYDITMSKSRAEITGTNHSFRCVARKVEEKTTVDPFGSKNVSWYFDCHDSDGELFVVELDQGKSTQSGNYLGLMNSQAAMKILSCSRN